MTVSPTANHTVLDFAFERRVVPQLRVWGLAVGENVILLHPLYL